MSDDPVRQAELVILRAQAVDQLAVKADLLDRAAKDAQRYADENDGDPVAAHAIMTRAIFDQLHDREEFLAALAAAAICRLAGMELRS